MTCVLCLSDLIHLLAFPSKDPSQTTLSCTKLLASVQTIFSSSSCFKMIDSCCWMLNCIITSPLCGTSDWAFVRYKMDLTSWTRCPPEVLLTSTPLLPLTHGLVTSDGQRGVNPSLLQTPATVKSGVTHKPVLPGKMHSTSSKRVGAHRVAKIRFDVSCAVEVQRLRKFNFAAPYRSITNYTVWF